MRAFPNPSSDWFLLFAILAIATILLPDLPFGIQKASAQTVTVAGYTVDANAAVDDIVMQPGADPTFYSCGEMSGFLNPTLPGKTEEESIDIVMTDLDSDTGALGKLLLEAYFIDNMVVNGPGPDLVVLELRTIDSFKVTITNLSGVSTTKSFTPSDTGTNTCSADNYNVNSKAIELSDFGVADGDTILDSKVVINNNGSPGSIAGGDILDIFALNSETQLPTVTLDKVRYGGEDIAQVTVNDVNAPGADPDTRDELTVRVTSDTDLDSLFVTVTETGPDTLVFVGDFSFTTEGPSMDTTLHVSSGDIVTAQYEPNEGDIFEATAGYGPAPVLVLDSTEYDPSGTATVMVTDPFANLGDSQDTVNVHVFSDSDEVGIDFDILETDDDTGEFQGTFDFTTTGDSSGTTLLVSDGDNIQASYVNRFNEVASDDAVITSAPVPTILILNPVSDVTATTGFTVSGNLTDAVTGEPLSGQLISFTGSGAASLESVTTEGVTFTGAIILVSCPTPVNPTPTTCTTDNIGTDDTTSNNMVLHLGVGDKITFPSSTVTAKLYLQDMGTSSFKYIVEEGNGATQTEATSAGALSPIVPVVNIISGFTDGEPNGIKEITITEGSVGIAAILTGNPDGLPVEQHQIDFEELAAGPQSSPFTVDAGHYFSTGFAQNTDASGLEITANFEGTDAYEGDSATQTHNVLANTAGLGGEGSQSTGGALGTSITSLDCNTDVGSVDSDNDGICDLWETSGITFGTATYILTGATIGAKDIFVEIDCMTGFCPTSTDLTAVRNVFSAEGFTLHIAVDENNLAVANPLHVWTDGDASSTNDFDKIKKNKFGFEAGTNNERSGGTLGSGNDFLEAKAQVYHYGLFAKNTNTGSNTACGPSGQAELRGNDFIVSVGCTGSNGFANSAQERQGTLMHELGHNLGLRHGGGDDDNCKANMISVMNYARQMPWASLSATTVGSNPTQWALTYSRQKLMDLNENGLQEAEGLAINTGQWGGTLASGSTSFKIIWGIPGIKTGATGSSVNWNWAAGNTAALNINTLSGMTGCSGTTKSTLKSYDEWTILDLNFRDGGTIDGVNYPDPDTVAELTPAVLEGAEGASVIGPNNISGNSGISITPDIVADSDNNVYMVWSDRPSGFSGNFDILFSKSTDGGVTFTPPTNISPNMGTSLTPRIAVSGTNLYVVWSDTTGGTSGKFDILFKKGLDGGNDWTTPTKNISFNPGDSLTPSLAVDNSNIYVVWSDKTGGKTGNFDILFKKSTDGGGTFTPDTASAKNISFNAGDSLTPSVGVSSSAIYVVWSDKTNGHSGNYDIQFKKSTDGGGTFSPNNANAKNISFNAGNSLTPSLAIDGSNLYVTWSDTSGGKTGKFDILFKKSTDGGGTFTPDSKNAENISTNSGESFTPRIAHSSGSIYVAWSDTTGGTSGKFDIFVKKSTDGGSTFDPSVNISTNAGHSITPSIALSGSTVHLVWGDFTPGITGDILYASRIV